MRQTRRLRCSLTLVAACLALFAPLARGQAPPPGPSAAEERRERLANDQLILADGLYRRGRQDDGQGKDRTYLKMAAAEYEKFVAGFPAHKMTPDAYLRWADCLRFSADMAGSVKALERLRQLHPAHDAALRALLKLSDHYLDAKRPDKALGLLDTVDPEELDAFNREAVYYYRGVAHHNREDAPRAIASFQRLAGKAFGPDFPYRAPAALSLAYLLRASKPEEAGALFKSLADNEQVSPERREESLFYLGEVAYARAGYPAATGHFGRLLKLFPDGRFAERARIGKAWALLQVRQHKAIFKLFEPVAGQSLPVSDESLYLQGLCLKELNQTEGMVNKLEELIKRFPRSSYLAYAEISVLEGTFALKRYRETIAMAQELLGRKTEHKHALDIHYFMAQSHLQLKEYLEAGAVLEQALEQYGGQWRQKEEAMMVLADIYGRMDKHAKAAETYRRVASLVGAKHRAKALLLAAESEMAGEAYEAAAKDYMRFLTKFPNDPDTPVALLNMAEIRSHAKEFDEAVKFLNRLLKDHPAHDLQAKALYLRGTIRYRAEKYREAIADLERCIETPKFTGKAFAKLFLGSALWADKQVDKAMQVLTEVLAQKNVSSHLSPHLLSELGQQYLEQRNPAAAEHCFKLLVAHKEAAVRPAGILGLGHVAFARQKYIEAAAQYEQLKKLAARDKQPELRARALSYLGESYRRLAKLDLASLAFEEALAIGILEVRSAALCRYGNALLHHARGKREEALSFAVSAYVLHDDAVYSPQAMLLAVRVLLERGEPEEAASIYKELDKRYPIALAEFRNRPENKDVFKHFPPK